MFQKKQYIYSETQGVCRVENIVQLRHGRRGEKIPYYVLKPVFDSEKISYIPVYDHQVVLRELFTEEEARALAKSEDIANNQKLQDAVDFVLHRKEEESYAGKRTSHS